MRVNVRAVIIRDGKLVISRERRQGVSLVTLDSVAAESMMPPIVEEISHDRDNGWAQQPRWLGNVRRPPRQSAATLDPAS